MLSGAARSLRRRNIDAGLRSLSDLRWVSGIGLGQDSADVFWEPGGCDTSIRWPCPGSRCAFRAGIFVVWDGIGLVTKWIEHVPHSDPPRVRLKSANPAQIACSLQSASRILRGLGVATVK